MTTLERLQTALSGLGLTGIEARLEVLLERASKQESAYGDFLLEVVSAEVEARRQGPDHGGARDGRRRVI